MNVSLPPEGQQALAIPMTAERDPTLTAMVVTMCVLSWLLANCITCKLLKNNRIVATDVRDMSDEEKAIFLDSVSDWENELDLRGGWLGALNFVSKMVYSSTLTLIVLWVVGNTPYCIIMICLIIIMSIVRIGKLYFKQQRFDATQRLESAQEVKNIFQDLSMPMVKVILTFGGQTALMGFLLYHFVTKLKWLDEYLFFWCVGVVITQAGRESIGVPFTEEHKFWLWAYAYHENGFIRDKGRPLEPQMPELLARFLMSVVSNDVYHYATIVALPFFVMTAETGIDFIKDVFAITFVINIDNLTSSYMLELPGDQQTIT